jgi:hypothetical protein
MENECKAGIFIGCPFIKVYKKEFDKCEECYEEYDSYQNSFLSKSLFISKSML